MARPQPEFGTFFLRSTHNRFVKTGPYGAALEVLGAERP